MPSNDQTNPFTTTKWLSVIGIGEDGVSGLGDDARERISAASVVFGGKRHLALAGTLITGEARCWPSPFDSAVEEVVLLRGAKVCVLASGDPFMHGVGSTLARRVAPEEMHVVPHVSAFSLAASRLGWALHGTDTISLHGRDIGHIRPLLHPGRRLFALTSDGRGPHDIARLLTRLGFGPSRFIVLEALGGSDERILDTNAAGFDLNSVNPLNLVAVEISASPHAAVIPLAPGLADEFFDHDGQITKSEIRSLTLAALEPCRGELLWDIGAGSGSIAIEWMLRHSSMRAFAIEENAERAARISANAHNLGVPSLRTVAGRAPGALAGLPQPDAIFIGGGGSDDGVAEQAIESLRSGGRLVANAVTVQMEAILLDLNYRLGGALTRIAVSRAAPIGAMTGWRPAMPVTQWKWIKS